MIRRVFISHTSEFTKYPASKSFIDAAIAAVNRAGLVPCDMRYFTSHDKKSAAYCQEKVRECDLYIGVIGFRYGSPVRDRPEVSYTELEFEAASDDPAKLRLVFLLDENATVPGWFTKDHEFGKRQETFRKRIQDAGLIYAQFRDTSQLELLIYQALVEHVQFTSPASGQETIEWPEEKSPYPGLEWFDEGYAPLYFGREREVDDVIAKMSEQQGRFILISGASGSGKSSMVAAGLWHSLVKEGRLLASEKWRWLRLTPSGDGRGVFESLASGLKQAFPKIPTPADDLAASLAKNTTTIGDLLAPHLSADQELLLFIDQLEELYTQGFKDEDIQHFLERLVVTARDRQNRVRVVTTVRSEFIGKLEESEPVLQVLNAGYHYHLGPVSPRILPEMIEKPAQATGHAFVPNLVDEILDEAGKEPGNLPLVAYALKQLFERRQGRTFMFEAYREIGGVAGAIGTKADLVMEKLDENVCRTFDHVFAELVHLERERPPTRKRAVLSAFRDEEDATALIQALSGPDCRVLVTSGETNATSVEVAHEKLFTAWPRLKAWLDDAGEALRLIEHAEEAARRWYENGERPEELWLGQRVQDVQKALKRFDKIPSLLFERFLNPMKEFIAQLDQTTLSHQDRSQIGYSLAQFGDPRPGIGLRADGLPDVEWIEIPPGQIKVEDVKHVFEVKPFRLAKYPVTNIQFQSFIDAKDGYQNEEWWQGLKQGEESASSSWSETNCPREMVSWYEAVAFCRWLSHRTDLPIRLPTEWEWQQAATGGDPMYEYPWFGGWDAARCNSNESRLNRTTPVGIYPSGVTQQGIMDIAGNVYEWCLNKQKHPDRPESAGIDDLGDMRVIRGGSWNSEQGFLRSSFRSRNFPAHRSNGIGFRLAQDTP
ncbi:MAG: SUMF1/EgtB/PvdO family nonheme iron enzyme [Nitrospira sp.]|nr:SUMF1/EgtB/PvdO family nonheme iron enzyme [Nitrospira sp.]